MIQQRKWIYSKITNCLALTADIRSHLLYICFSEAYNYFAVALKIYLQITTVLQQQSFLVVTDSASNSARTPRVRVPSSLVAVLVLLLSQNRPELKTNKKNTCTLCFHYNFGTSAPWGATQYMLYMLLSSFTKSATYLFLSE